MLLLDFVGQDIEMVIPAMDVTKLQTLNFGTGFAAGTLDLPKDD
jgi:hypothetical protein